MFANNLGTFEHLILDEDTMLHVLASVELDYDSNTIPDAWQEAQALQESHIDQMNIVAISVLSNAYANCASNKKIGGKNNQNMNGRGKGLGLNKYKGCEYDLTRRS